MNKYIETICKIGQGVACCRYLVVGTRGFECYKFNPKDKEVVDNNWATYKHVAQGDNCEGQEHLRQQP